MPTPDETALNGLEEEQDELEALLESYTRQAEAECAASGAAATAARSTAVRGRSRSGGSRGGGTAAATGRGGGASRGSGGSKSMEAAREEGLARPLGSDNRGYRMLLKMGYSQGSALGGPQKSGSASTGLSEPIRVELKSGRAGLGVQEQQKRRRVELQERQAVVMQDRAQASLLQAESYQHSQQDAFSHRQQLRQLGGAWSAARELDRQAGVAAGAGIAALLPHMALQEREGLGTASDSQTAEQQQRQPQDTDTSAGLPQELRPSPLAAESAGGGGSP
ncbi:MAG: hypothetical protein WDW36_009660 [Sanguina aurantia]